MSTPHIDIHYLRALISVANEVLDFQVHSVILFDGISRCFTHTWHFIDGLEILKKTRSKRTFCLKVLREKQTKLCARSNYQTKPKVGRDELWVPLFLDHKEVGVLCLEAPPKKQFSLYDAYIAGCVADVVATGFTRKDKGKNLFRSLQFCMLHRKHFLSATPNLEDILKDYLHRITAQKQFPALLGKVSANFRIVYPMQFEKDKFDLRFALFSGKIPLKSRQHVSNRHKILNAHSIDRYLDSWAQSKIRLSKEIDNKYMTIFPNIHSHIAVPCQYSGELHGILSLDSIASRQFNKLVVQWLSIIAAQAAPIIANAQYREKSDKEQRYLHDVLDAIPDEISIVDSQSRIVFMNHAKMNSRPNAKIGQKCYKAFEYGMKKECPGCRTLHTLRTGEPVKQALWQYTSKGVPHEPAYVELSAGKIIHSPHNGPEAVEVCRVVNVRETMLKWIEKIQSQLLWAHEEKKPRSRAEISEFPDKIWSFISLGLDEMGFTRHQIYTYRNSSFFGKICKPADDFSKNNFSDHFISVKNDIPSQILLRDSKLRPIKFVVDKQLKRSSYIPKRQIQWNYLTCKVKKIPNARLKSFSHTSINSWVEIPIGVLGKIYGKISVYRKSAEEKSDMFDETSFDNAQTMAILACFGRFASVAMHVALEHIDLVQIDKKNTMISQASSIAHEFASLQGGAVMNIEYIRNQIPALLEEPPDISAIKHDKKFFKAYEAIRKRLFCSNLLTPGELTKSQGRLATDTVEIAKTHGLDCEEDQVTPFIISATILDFRKLIRSSSSEKEIHLLRYLLILANTLSKLDATVDTYKTMSMLNANLSLSSMLETTPIATNIEDTIQAAIRIVKSANPSIAKIKLESDHRNKLPVIYSPPYSLRIVWVNLIKNAVQATSGRLPVLIQTSLEKHSITVKISDKGPGLPTQIAKMIAGPVNMHDSIMAPALGLKITKRIVTIHGGTLKVISSCPKGTTLSVRIPIKGAKV